MSAPTIQVAKNILLTGAGFTKPFRGYLASEMWALILNQPEIHKHPSLRRCLLGNLNFEAAYDLILRNESNEYDEVQQRAFIAALDRAYQHLHVAVCSDFQESAYHLCRLLLKRFSHVNQNEKGVVFTLNQDLFFERYFSMGFCDVSIPGLHGDTWFRARHSEKFVVEPTELPSSEKVKELESRFWSTKSPQLAYFKLHGSLGWRSASGNESLIVGTTKASAIQKEPLLYWYSALFKQVLHAGDRHLLVIGYGFGDPHINAVIAEGVEKHGLKLFIVNPQSPEHLRNQLVPPQRTLSGLFPSPQGQVIWDGLAGYYVRSTDQLIDTDWNLSHDGVALIDRLELA